MFHGKGQHAGKVAVFNFFGVIMNMAVTVMMILFHTNDALGKYRQTVAVLFEPCRGLFAGFVVLFGHAFYQHDQHSRFTAFRQFMKCVDIGIAIRRALRINHFKQNDIASVCA